MIRRITVGDFRRAFHVKRGHNREHPERNGRRSGGVDRSRGGNLVAGHDLRNGAWGSRAFRWRGGFVWSRRGGWLGADLILAKYARR